MSDGRAEREAHLRRLQAEIARKNQVLQRLLPNDQREQPSSSSSAAADSAPAPASNQPSRLPVSNSDTAPPPASGNQTNDYGREETPRASVQEGLLGLMEFLKSELVKPRAVAAAPDEGANEDTFAALLATAGSFAQQVTREGHKAIIAAESTRKRRSEREELLEDLWKPCDTCVSALVAAANLPWPCTALRAECLTRAKRLVEACKAMIDRLDDEKPPVALCGAVEEICKSIKDIPTTNAHVTRAALASLILVARDTQLEFTELMEQDEEEEDLEDEDEEENELDFKADPLTPEERDRLKLCVEILAGSMQFLETVELNVTTRKSSSWYDDVLVGSTKLSKAIGDFAVELYPPQETQDVGARAETVRAAAADLSQRCFPDGEVNEAVARLIGAIQIL